MENNNSEKILPIVVCASTCVMFLLKKKVADSGSKNTQSENVACVQKNSFCSILIQYVKHFFGNEEKEDKFEMEEQCSKDPTG